MEESGDLLVLDTRDIGDPAVVTIVRGIQKKGHGQNDSFVTDRLVERTSPVSDVRTVCHCSTDHPKGHHPKLHR